MPNPNDVALKAIHEFLGIAQKKICPQPDKPESDWAKLKAAVDGLALLAASQPSPVVLDDERAAFEMRERARRGFGDDTLTPYPEVKGEYLLSLVQARWEGWQARVEYSKRGATGALRELVRLRDKRDAFHKGDQTWTQEDDDQAIAAFESARSVLARAASPQASATQPAQTELRRIAHELRTYNPAADEYKGEHIHKVWARKIDALLTAAQPASDRSSHE